MMSLVGNLALVSGSRFSSSLLVFPVDCLLAADRSVITAEKVVHNFGCSGDGLDEGSGPGLFIEYRYMDGLVAMTVEPTGIYPFCNGPTISRSTALSEPSRSFL